MELLAGRRGLIVGVANARSLASAIAHAAVGQGAALLLAYQGPRLQRSVQEVVDALPGPGRVVEAFPCDVQDPAAVAALLRRAQAHFGGLDFLVHAVAAAPREALAGRFVETSREAFRLALEVSVYSLVELSRQAAPLLCGGTHPSVLTLTYEGSRRAYPNYNVMGVAKAALESAVRYLAADLGPQGIRVNALSAGPVKTLSSAGVQGLRTLLREVPRQAPLRRNVEAAEVGEAALFALSRLGRGMTGEVFHVDAGLHAVGAAPLTDDAAGAMAPA